MLSSIAASSDGTTAPSPSAATADAAKASAFADTLAAQKRDDDRAHAQAKVRVALSAKDTKTLGTRVASLKSGEGVESGADGEGGTASAKPSARRDAAAAVATAKAESAANLAAGLLTAIGATGATVAAAGADAGKFKSDDTDVAAIGPKGKAKALAAAKRDGTAEPKTKAEAATERDGAKATKAAPATAAPATPEAKSVTAKAPDAAPLPSESAAPSAKEPPPAPVATGSSAVEVRVPLAREASAQAGAAAPIVAMRVHSKDGVTKAIELRLDPQGLGPVNVKLETDSEGRIRAVVSADKSEAFELLKRDGSTLEAALRAAGVDLGEDGVSFSLNDGGQSGADSGQRNAAYNGAASRRDAALGDVLANPLASAAAVWRDGVIDISV